MKEKSTNKATAPPRAGANKKSKNSQFHELWNRIRSYLSPLASPFVLGLVVTFTILSLTQTFYNNYGRPYGEELFGQGLAFVSWIHEKSIDLRLRDRGPVAGSDEVAILAIDERSIEQEGRWPWSHAKMAQLVDATIAAGAKSIAFDIIFAEPEVSSQSNFAKLLQDQITKEDKVSDSLKTLVAGEIEQTDADQKLGETVKKFAPQLILGSYFDSTRLAQKQLSVDSCIKALNQDSPTERKWEREAIQIKVKDANLFPLPEPLYSHLREYLANLAINGADAWLEKNQQSKQTLLMAFSHLGAELPPDQVAVALQMWASGHFNDLLDTLEQALPSLKTPSARKQLEQSFAAAIPAKELAALQGILQDAGELYCGRFLSKDDELLSIDVFKKRGADPAAFDGISWQKAWQDAKLPGDFNAWVSANANQSVNTVESAGRFWMNIDKVADNTMNTGYFNAKQDSDGSIRRTMLIAHQGERYYPSLALKSYLAGSGYQAEVDLQVTHYHKESEKSVSHLKILDSKGELVQEIPVDRYGRLMINYAGGRSSFAYISAADIMRPEDNIRVEKTVRDPGTGRWEIRSIPVSKKEFLKGKRLILGATATGVYDLRVTPFDENFPGVETHANVLSNLLTSEAGGAHHSGFLKTDPREPIYIAIFLSIIGIGLSALLTWLNSISGLIVTSIALLGTYAADKYLVFNSGTVVAVIFPVAMIVGVFVTLTFYKYFTEERTKRELKGTFEKYVSPAIVAEVLKDPSNIELGGKKMELTVLFSDIRGFTKFSEKLDPKELSDFLNSYLTPMTNLVFAHKGTLDKYMGDAIMAFWGAPIHFQDHACHAARCALAMLTKLAELSIIYRERGLPDIDIGIGLNSGEMSVGNMGSDTVRSYTVMGDSVNLGSRLEGINKEYGTHIIVSEFTNKAIEHQFLTREVDWVRVKGKAQPVRIFELVAEKTKTLQKLEGHYAVFAQGFSKYHEKDFAGAQSLFEQAVSLSPNDECSKLYIKRCIDYLEDPPSADWDGVHIMKTK